MLINNVLGQGACVKLVDHIKENKLLIGCKAWYYTKIKKKSIIRWTGRL